MILMIAGSKYNEALRYFTTRGLDKHILYQNNLSKIYYTLGLWQFKKKRLSVKIKLFKFQVCIKLNQSSQNSFDFLGICKNYLQKHYDLYHYNDNEVGERFRGEKISEKNVEKAREAYKKHHTEMDEFQSKLLATKRDSAEAYIKMMEDLEDNLKRKKKMTKCPRNDWSRVSNSMISNYNLGTFHVFTEQFLTLKKLIHVVWDQILGCYFGMKCWDAMGKKKNKLLCNCI